MDKAGGAGPCPCGSGRQFRDCCADPAARTAIELRAGSTRESAISKLLAFAFQPAFDNDHTVAETTFWGDVRTVPTHELQLLMDSEDATIKYNAWFLFDWDVDGDGRVVELFLQEDEGLAAAEREFLIRVARAPLRLYEVEAVERGRGLQLRDLWSGARTWVIERTASTQVVTWDLIGARVAQDGLGGHVFEGGLYLYPLQAKGEIVGRFRRLHRRYQRKYPGHDSAAFFRKHGMVFHHLWLNLVVFPAPQQVMTPEGEPLMFCRAVFDAGDIEAVQSVIRGQPDVHPLPEGGFAWSSTTAEGVRQLGRWTFAGQRVHLETTSQGRAARGREWLEALAGPNVTYRATALETLDHAMAEIRRPPERHRLEVPVGEDSAVRELYDQHYRSWLDRPDAHLGNRTPRSVARTRLGRARLMERLKELENDAERAALSGRPAYDFRWIWRELDLERL